MCNFSKTRPGVKCFNYIDDIYMLYPKNEEQHINQLVEYLESKSLSLYKHQRDDGLAYDGSKSWVVDDMLEFEVKIFRISASLYEYVMSKYWVDYLQDKRQIVPPIFDLLDKQI